MKVEILPHPPEVIDVDPEVIEQLKRRLAEPRTSSPTKPSIFDRD